MSKEKPEVGDVWEVGGVKAVVLNTINYIHPNILLENGYTDFLCGLEPEVYLGKSKVNIEDLFKTENE